MTTAIGADATIETSNEAFRRTKQEHLSEQIDCAAGVTKVFLKKGAEGCFEKTDTCGYSVFVQPIGDQSIDCCVDTTASVAKSAVNHSVDYSCDPDRGWCVIN